MTTETPKKERSFLDVAKEMDKVKKALTKAEGKLNAVEEQMKALDAKKKQAMEEIGDLDEDMDELKAEYEGLLNG